MKKIGYSIKKVVLFSVFGLIGLTLQAQIQKNTTVTVKDSVALAADTTIVNKTQYSYDYAWVLTVLTYDVDAADAQVKIQFANDTTLTNSWIDYDTNSTLTLTDTLGSHAFEGETFLYKYLRVVTIPNSVTAGEYTVTLDKITRR